MEVLRHEQFEKDPNSSTAAIEWLDWKRTFENFLSEGQDKFNALVNFVSPTVFQCIEEAEDYAVPITMLEALFTETSSEFYCRNLC